MNIDPFKSVDQQVNVALKADPAANTHKIRGGQHCRQGAGPLRPKIAGTPSALWKDSGIEWQKDGFGSAWSGFLQALKTISISS